LRFLSSARNKTVKALEDGGYFHLRTRASRERWGLCPDETVRQKGVDEMTVLEITHPDLCQFIPRLVRFLRARLGQRLKEWRKNEM